MVRLLWVLWASVALYMLNLAVPVGYEWYKEQRTIELRIEYELMLIEKAYFDMQYPRGKQNERT